MSSIRILPDRVANQIAAGEVVERPAAVVKELVENSIDADATSIEVEYRNGGKSYLRVEDDGKGMNADEALLCLERHATSKIRDADDLLTVTSLGFRGEAIPSISSVSRFVMRTRARGSEEGREVYLNGGKLIHSKECGMPVGTRIEVSQLFNSVPARRKFLKTDATESAHICHLTRLYALANPGIAFELSEGNRTIFRSPTCSSLLERVREIFGKGLSESLESIESIADGLRLDGLIAKPGMGRSTRKEMLFFVNGRPVESKTLSYAVLEAFHTYAPKGRFPPVVLFLEIDPREIDVNVHPAKRELRFRHEGKARGFLIGAISERLKELSGMDRLIEVPLTNGDEPKDGSLPLPEPSALPSRNTFARPEIAPTPTATGFASASKPDDGMAPVASPETFRRNVGLRDDVSAPWRLLGRAKGDLALFSTEAGVVAMHCRAAYERVRLEQVEDAMSGEKPVESQVLLMPEPVELDRHGEQVLKRILPELQAHGFAVEEFGRHFYRVEACPAWIEPGEAVSFLRDFIDLVLESGGGSAGEEVIRKEVARLASVGGRAAGEDFSDEEIVRLAESLLSCRNPLTCPKGNPTYEEYPWRDWEKRFGRGL